VVSWFAAEVQTASDSERIPQGTDLNALAIARGSAPNFKLETTS
jgi:hypothetical protein